MIKHLQKEWDQYFLKNRMGIVSSFPSHMVDFFEKMKFRSLSLSEIDYDIETNGIIFTKKLPTYELTIEYNQETFLISKGKYYSEDFGVIESDWYFYGENEGYEFFGTEFLDQFELDTHEANDVYEFFDQFDFKNFILLDENKKTKEKLSQLKKEYLGQSVKITEVYSDQLNKDIYFILEDGRRLKLRSDD